MDYAIIMRSKNERPYLDNSLKALSEQTVKNFTLYNIDSGSTDGSLEIIRQSNPHVVEIKPEEYVPGPVLNRMIAMAKEPIIVLLNGDAIPQTKDWLEKLVFPIVNGEADATMSKQIPRKDAHFIVKFDMDRAYSQNVIDKQPYFFSAVACAFKRSLWEKTKFSDVGYSEDMDWRKRCQDKGARFMFVPDSIVEHSHNYTFVDWYHRGFIEGEGEKRILDESTSIFWESWLCLREIGRDFFYAISHWEPLTIPYNICYRIVGHAGKYRGKKCKN